MMNSYSLDQQHFYPGQPSSLNHLTQCLMKLVLSLNSLLQDLLDLELMIFSSCLMNFCHLIRHLMTSNYLKSFSMNPQHLNSSYCFHCLKHLSLSYYCLRCLKHLNVCCLMTSFDCLRYLKYLIVCCLKPCLMSFQHLNSTSGLMNSFHYYLKSCLNLTSYLTSFLHLNSFYCCSMILNCFYSMMMNVKN